MKIKKLDTTQRKEMVTMILELRKNLEIIGRILYPQCSDDTSIRRRLGRMCIMRDSSHEIEFTGFYESVSLSDMLVHKKMVEEEYQIVLNDADINACSYTDSVPYEDYDQIYGKITITFPEPDETYFYRLNSYVVKVNEFFKGKETTGSKKEELIKKLKHILTDEEISLLGVKP
jgi:hypothetical protein